MTTEPLGGYTYGDAAHADAATVIGSAWSAAYDAAGNMTCRASIPSVQTCLSGGGASANALSYDNEGRLATWANVPSSPTSTASSLYDGAGQRVEQVATASGTTTTTAYLGALEEVATSGSTTTTTAYYGGLAESVNGTLAYLLADELGSVAEAVATSGGVSATQLYGPSGTVRYQSGTLPTSKGFTGQRADAATSGLDYYNARYYDALAEQFTSADTWLAGGLNRYAYVGGNPETFVDPSGHEYRLGDEGVGGGIDGGDTTGSSGGGSGGSSTSSADDNAIVAPTATGSELTYDAGSPGSIHFDAPDGQNGPIDGIDGPDGQLLETNAEIESQAEANAQDRLSQGNQPHTGDDGQPNTGNAHSSQQSSTGNDPSPSDIVQQAENVRTENGTTSHAAGAIASVNETTMTATSGAPSTSPAGIGDNSTCAECHLGQVITTQFPQGPNGERPLEGQTIYVGVSQVSGSPPCPTCQSMFDDLANCTGATISAWSADRVVPRGPFIGISGPFILLP